MEAADRRVEEYSRGRQLLFDDIEVGMALPEVLVRPTPDVCRRYAEAIGDEAGGEEAPPTVVCLYGTPSALFGGFDPKVIPPPGNIHYSQEYDFQRAVRPGDALRIRSAVTAKDVRRGRRYVTIESEYVNQRDERVAVGRITAVWSR